MKVDVGIRKARATDRCQRDGVSGGHRSRAVAGGGGVAGRRGGSVVIEKGLDGRRRNAMSIRFTGVKAKPAE